MLIEDYGPEHPKQMEQVCGLYVETALVFIFRNNCEVVKKTSTVMKSLSNYFGHIA